MRTLQSCKIDVGNLPGHLLFSICLGDRKFQLIVILQFCENEAGSFHRRNLPENRFVSNSSNII